MESLRRVLVSMGAATEATGVGQVLPDARIDPRRVKPGDVVIINGPVGDHGMTIMCQREGLSMQGDLASDTRPLHREVEGLIERFGRAIHCLRDMTRGGLASVMNEIARAAGVTIALKEQAIPVNPPVRSACELLGLDPLYVANEGKLAIFAEAGTEKDILALLRETDLVNQPAVIGRVTEPGGADPARGGADVVLEGILGVSRVLDMLSGEQLPRIC